MKPIDKCTRKQRDIKSLLSRWRSMTPRERVEKLRRRAQCVYCKADMRFTALGCWRDHP